MMVTTHALVGAVLAAVALLIAPESFPVAVLAGVAGGVAPDLDLYAGHRRTLHFPVYGPLAATFGLGVAVLVPSTVTVALAVFLLAFGLHATMDALGGGLELRPWEGRSERAVYSHYHGRWLRPRRWVRYDGAPEDVATVALLAGLLSLVHDGPIVTAAVAVTVLSAAYGLLRKPLADCWARLARSLPAPVVPYLPERFLD